MSLEKFQATEIWRNKFKNHLLAERKPPPPVTSAAPVVRLPHRLSFELSEDLLVILEEKKIPEGRKMPRVRGGEDNKENCDRPQHERVHNTPTKLKRTYKYDATMLEDTSDVLQITNTSFSALEEMCEKTASDPDSTLFRYLHHDEPRESQVTRSVRPPTHDEEADALQRLLDELNVEETEKRLAQPSPNDTQLDDIEAPSRFWENTLTPETLQSISPVKMVGLMRQSTIMEECSDVSETETSGTSYQSATKTGWTSETTGCYETANDTVSGSENGAVKKVSINTSAASSTSSDLFQQRSSRQRFFSETKEEVHEESVQLIDLDATAVVYSSPEAESSESLDTPDSPDSSDSPQSSNSLPSSNLLHSSNSADFSKSPGTPNSSQPVENNTTSSEESTNEPEDSLELEPLKSSMESTQATQTDVSSSVIDVSDDDSLGCKILEKIESQEADSVLNRSFTIDAGKAEDEDKSLHFNDTMEEVEYMMKKGMQYMQAAKVESSSVKNNLTPVKNAERFRSPSPMLSSPRTPSTVIAKPKPINKFAMDIKPFPKLDLFKKPQAARLKAPTVENKFVAGVKKTQYSHVYSPIRAYINKTATTPLITAIKPSCTGTSKAFKQLDIDSRMEPNTAPVQPSTQSPKKFPSCSLPKKAYISSDLKHIVDERTPVTIPGGQKIHRYLTNALLPAVVRHDGKVKLPADMRTSDMGPPQAPRPTDDSLADLSLASGDVSLYTIKDAQKF